MRCRAVKKPKLKLDDMRRVLKALTRAIVGLTNASQQHTREIALLRSEMARRQDGR